jgi:hypothetical protein
MRLTGMSRLAKGMQAEDYPALSADLEDMLEHLKWNLWRGKVPRALEIVDELVYALDAEDGSPAHRKLLKAARAFEGYLTNNRALFPITASATGREKSSRRALWSRPSTRWSVNGS